MTEKYIELRANRSFGDIITVYFEFLKLNLKGFSNTFLSYNGIWLVLLLVVSYFLTSGVLELIANEQNQSWLTETGDSEKTITQLVLGLGLFFILFLIVGVINYGLATNYMILYEEQETTKIDKREVWRRTTAQLGRMILFFLLLIALFIGLMIASFVLLLIPIVGIFAYYIILFFFLAWIGVGFFSMLKNKKGPGDGLGESWQLVTKNFWTSVGVNFILGILNNILQVLISVGPLVLIGVYTYHVVTNEVNLADSVVSSLVYTIGVWVALSVAIFAYCLTQFANGVLYYALHEKTHNTFTQKRIEQIGKKLH